MNNRRIFTAILGLLILSGLAGRSEACDSTPVAEIVSPSSGHTICVGGSVSFDGKGTVTISPATGSYDPDNGYPYGGGRGITKYEWHYGDEAPGDPYWHNDGGTTSHPYSVAKKYTVKLRVTDDDNPNKTKKTSCIVNVVKVQSVVGSPTLECVNKDVIFTAHPYPVETPPLPLDCIEWQKQYKANAMDPWLEANWTSASGTDASATLNTPTAGYYIYRARNGSDDEWQVSNEVRIIDGLTVLPGKDYVCVNSTESFEAWACVGGSPSNVTSSATFTTSNIGGDMKTSGGGGGPGNNILHASGTPSATEGCDWVRASHPTYGNTDAAHDCDLTVFKVDITDDGGTPITTTQTVCVGEKISLKTKVEPTLSGLSWQWTIPGTVVKDYKKETLTGSPPGRTKRYVVELTDTDKQQSTIQFYWVDGADGRDVSVSGTKEEVTLTCTDTVTFDVKRPTLDNVASATGPVDVSSVWGFLMLHFGTPTEPGCNWGAMVTAPTGFNGTLKFTQLVNLDHIKTYTSGTEETATTFESWLDNAEPYGSTYTATGGVQTTMVDNDSPGLGLAVGFKKIQVFADFYDVYVMFKPTGAGAIWVPIAKLEWGWGGTAESSDGGSTWSKTGGAAAPEDPSWSVTTEFAEWPDTAIDSLPYPPWE